MKMSQLADKILHDMVKDFIDTGNEFSSGETLLEKFPDEKKHIVFGAVGLLETDGFVTVCYGDDEPNTIGLNMIAVRNCDENSFIKKGYTLLKEVRSWF